MRSPIAIVVATLLSAPTTASAQVATPETVSSAFGVDPIIRVTSVFRAKIAGIKDLNEVPDIKAQEAVRKNLYDMAANECSVLAAALKAECRLNNITMINPIVVPSISPVPPVMTATALYELKPGR